jgi:hypothetical protein
MNAEQSSFRVGINKFADLSDEEYSQLLGLKERSTNEVRKAELLEVNDIPTEVDWRKVGAVTSVKD